MSWSKFAIVLPLTMLLIAIIDYRLGATAQHINGYEILRRSFAISWPEVTERYIVGQEYFGRAALPWSWFVWALEASLAIALVSGLVRLASSLMRVATEVAS